MAHSMYRKVVHRDSEAMLLNKFKLYIGLTIIPAFVASVCLLAGKYAQQQETKQANLFCLFANLGVLVCVLVCRWCTYLRVCLPGDMFGDATFYCWLRTKMWQFVALYLWVALAIVYVCVILFMTHVHVARRAQRQGNLDAIESSWRIMLKLRIYIVAFVVLWLPSLVYRSG